MIDQKRWNAAVVLQGEGEAIARLTALLEQAACYPAGRELHRRLEEVGSAAQRGTTPEGFAIYGGRYALVSHSPNMATTGDGKGSATQRAYAPARDNYRPGIDRVQIDTAGTGAEFVYIWIGSTDLPGLPAFTTLHHELVHAYHYLSGRRLWYPDPRDKVRCDGMTVIGNHEESQTIGLRSYDLPYAENALRRQAGLPVRTTWHSACEA